MPVFSYSPLQRPSHRVTLRWMDGVRERITLVSSQSQYRFDPRGRNFADDQDHGCSAASWSPITGLAAGLFADDQVVAGLLEYPQVRLGFNVLLAESRPCEHRQALHSGAHCIFTG